MKLDLIKTDIAELSLVEKVGKTVIIIFYLRFPGLRREFMCARPLNILWDFDEKINFDNFDLTDIEPLTADSLLIGKSVRTMQKFGIIVHNEVQFKVENYYWPYLKSFPSSNFNLGTDFDKLVFYLQDDNLKNVDSRLIDFEQIAHLGYDHSVYIEYFRIGLSIVWANYLKIPTKIITESDETTRNYSKGTIELIESQFKNLRVFSKIPKEFWYCPLPKEIVAKIDKKT